MESYPNSRPVSPSQLTQRSSTWTLLASWVVSVTMRMLVLTSALGKEHSNTLSSESMLLAGVGSSQVSILIISLFSIVYTIQHLISPLHGYHDQSLPPKSHQTQKLFFVIIRFILAFWLVAMIASSVVASKPCLNGGQECNLRVVTLVASALSDLLIIAHLTAREMYHSSPESPWTVRVRKPTYRGRMFDNGRLEPIQPTFSSASTIYEREPPTNARAKRIIKRKPLPQSTFIPGQFPSESVPALSPPAMLRAIPQEYGITRLPSLDRTPKVPPHFESAVPVSKCSCCHINHWDPKLASPPATPRPTHSGKPAKAHSTKKSHILRQANTAATRISTARGFSPPSIPPPHKWSNSRTASLSELLPVTDKAILPSKGFSAPIQATARIRRQAKHQTHSPFPLKDAYHRGAEADPYAIEVPGTATRFRGSVRLIVNPRPCS